MDRLENTVRAYDWGTFDAIPALLGRSPNGRPQAELWLGAHPGAPSTVMRGGARQPLFHVIAQDPERALGAATVARLGRRLPFLLKVLSARKPLSIQVHPTLAQAAAGFAREETLGVPVNAPARNYRDTNHKPELLCALTDFEALCGFRPAQATAAMLEQLGVTALQPLVRTLRRTPEKTALRDALAQILSLPPARARALSTGVSQALGRHRLGQGELSACLSAAEAFPGDVGVVAALLLDRVRLRPGQALFLPAGVPHAYLRGTGVEIMAASDNVLRCGLTAKHVDVAEVLQVVDFDARVPEPLDGQAGPDGAVHYPAPVADFQLSRYSLTSGGTADLDAGLARILLCTEGTVLLRPRGGGPVTLSRGASVFCRADESVSLAGSGTVFCAAPGRTG